jgi:ribosome-associated protein
VVVLDLRRLSDVTDYFMICHGTSDRQVLAIADAIEDSLRSALRLRPGHVEGRRHGDWVLMDYIDFVVHVFVEEKREFYRLESLWGDAPRLSLDDGGRPSAARA